MGDTSGADARRSPRGGAPTRAAALILAVLGVLLLLCGAGGASAAPDSGSGSGTGSDEGSAAPPVSQSVRLAAALRADPVYVTDQLPRVVPRSTAPAFAALAKTTGVPTYVLVLPDHGGSGDALLGTVHDRLGRDGLYVEVDDMGVAAAKAFGVRAPADDARTIALYALPYDAGPLRSFRVFTEAIASGPARAAHRADQLEKKYGNTGREVAPDYIDSTDRANQSFLTGIALTCLPLSVLLIGWFLRARRRRTRARGAVGGGGAGGGVGGGGGAGVTLAKGGRPPGKPAGRSTRKGAKGAKDSRGAEDRTVRGGRVRALLPESAAALLLVLGIVLLAPQLFDQTTDSAASPPTRADLTARVDRVAAGLRQGAVYTDPESPQVLDAARLAELRRKIAAFRTGPIRLAVVPQLPDDESAGDSEAFVTALHARLAADGGGAPGTDAGKGSGGLYVVADPLSGDIDVYDYGLPLDDLRLTLDLPMAIAYDRSDDASDDNHLGDRLDQLMAYIAKVPHAAADPSSGPDQPPEAVSAHKLPGLFHGDFFPGLFVGAFGAAVLVGLTAAGTGTGAALRRRARRGPRRAAVAEPPSRASTAYLAQAARRETDALATRFAAAAPDAPHRDTAWDCLDTAMLLLGDHDGDGDGRGGDGHDGDGRDAGARAAESAAATVLAQAGLAALAGRPYLHCCAVNPLHGAAATGGAATDAAGPSDRVPSARRAAARAGRRCDGCRAAASRGPDALDRRRLFLPGPHGSWRPYEEAPGPLPTARDGIARLIAGTREYTHVQ
ncbi:hypothetical protein AB0399_38225 [Streptomyces sp. NPDC088194]|uniref:hypothetical protein n=1 Tax=Streptomyces sp. NPDC088194 TaxID=3154931 RepID=UPI00344C57B8